MVSRESFDYLAHGAVPLQLLEKHQIVAICPFGELHDRKKLGFRDGAQRLTSHSSKEQLPSLGQVVQPIDEYGFDQSFL